SDTLLNQITFNSQASSRRPPFPKNSITTPPPIPSPQNPLQSTRWKYHEASAFHCIHSIPSSGTRSNPRSFNTCERESASYQNHQKRRYSFQTIPRSNHSWSGSVCPTASKASL